MVTTIDATRVATSPWAIPNSSEGFSLLELEKMRSRDLQDNCFGWWIGAELQQESKIPDADADLTTKKNLPSGSLAADEIDGIESTTSTPQGATKSLNGQPGRFRERRDSGFDDDVSSGCATDSVQGALQAPSTALCYTPERLVKSDNFRILVQDSSPSRDATKAAEFGACRCCCCCCRSRSPHLHGRPEQQTSGRVEGDDYEESAARRPLGSRDDDRAGAADLEALLRKGASSCKADFERSARESTSRMNETIGEAASHCCCYSFGRDSDVPGCNEPSKNRQLSRRPSPGCVCCPRCASKTLVQCPDDRGDSRHGHRNYGHNVGREDERRKSSNRSQFENSQPQKEQALLKNSKNEHGVDSATMHNCSALQELGQTDAVKLKLVDDVLDEEQNILGSASWEGKAADAATATRNETRHESGSRAGLEPLKDRLRGLHDSNGSIVDDLAELRADFSREEMRIEHLLDDTRKLRNEVNELRYLDDLLNLLNGRLDKIPRRSWPFTIRHKRLKHEEVNLIV